MQDTIPACDASPLVVLSIPLCLILLNQLWFYVICQPAPLSSVTRPDRMTSTQLRSSYHTAKGNLCFQHIVQKVQNLITKFSMFLVIF
ncbi:hypothetical protein GDO78_012940 [Eleutherodactylus coqui]|uniref:Uncharacterized protein n=1 Tax=Eleutherodactylus coqui TaxID=57060 RepID=A0A8J6K1P1_ELECQ|nr:hypothetical protein GDO78_012940 [Eleutherodactylus coqui]